ncbi:hypothetical protein LGN70_24615, partial [Escherichia coli]|nr:hypothetical protein [Escherichia coli]
FCGACGNNRTNRGGFQFAAARLPWFNAEKIIISLFSAPARRITVQRYNTTYSAMGNCMRHYMLC